MTEWLTSLPGTEAGRSLAVALALMSAFAHAFFGALQTGRVDPWLARGAIDAWLFVLSAPLALLLVPWPEGALWWVLLGALAIHFVYKLGQAMAYERAPYTVVYPVVRGTGPLVTVLFAVLVFAESYSVVQWSGILLLSGGILALSWVNLAAVGLGRRRLAAGLGLALFTGVMVAVYTTWDAYGIRAAQSPLTFLAWFFFVTAVDFPVLAYWRYRRMAPAARPPLGPLALRGLLGALVAFFSFGGVMVATYLGKIGEAAVLRETSTVFAALIGWLVLREHVGFKRGALMVLIAGGAIIAQMG